MKEKLNKYRQKHDEFIDALVKFYHLDLKFIERSSPQRTLDLRNEIRRLRVLLKDMSTAAQERKAEYQAEWHEEKLQKRIKKNERNSKRNQNTV